MEKISKTEAGEQIKNFFEDIKNKSPKEIRKMKKLAMSKNIPLRELRKKFCKKCFSPLEDSKTRIKEGMKIIACKKCEYISRWKLKN